MGHTVVPAVKPVKSRVVPAGTVMPLRTMLVQLVLPLMALAASVKVQLARSSRTGAAWAEEAKRPRAAVREVREAIMVASIKAVF